MSYINNLKHMLIYIIMICLLISIILTCIISIYLIFEEQNYFAILGFIIIAILPAFPMIVDKLWEIFKVD